MTLKRAAWVLTEQIYAESRAALLPQSEVQQEVLVLRDGFSGFQAKYRVCSSSCRPGPSSHQARSSQRNFADEQNDPVLIEKFNKRYHD